MTSGIDTENHFISIGKEKNERSVLPPVRVECISMNCSFGNGGREQKIFAEDTCLTIFCIDGNIRISELCMGTNTERLIPSGCFSFFSCPESECCILCKSKVCSRVLQVFSPLSTLFSLIGENRLPPAVINRETEDGSKPVIREITPHMTRVIGVLCDEHLRNKGPYLLTLSKALELLWLSFGSLASKLDQGIDENDRRAVQQAMLILDSSLDSPPCLSQLAGMVGMSASKFKNLFPKVFGIPPYEYLRKKRMEKAMYLLNSGGMNVTEVAMEVGYSSFSHFTKAFYREYGITPSQLKKIRRE